jgi:hypothetical protein
MAAFVASPPRKVTIPVAPTDSVKTWVEGLVARHFCRLDQKRRSDSREALMHQAAEKHAFLDFGIFVIIMQRLCDNGPSTDVGILTNTTRSWRSQTISPNSKTLLDCGSYKASACLSLGATSSINNGRLRGSLLEPQTTVKLKSEYEMVHGVRLVGIALVIVCNY